MKKHIAFILTTALTVLLASCGDTSAVDSMIAKQEESGSSQAAVSPIDESTPSPDDIAADYWQGKETSPVPDQVDLNELDTSNGDVDVDLTVLDSNIVYAQVFDMLTYPENYIGKTVKAKGTFAYTTDPSTGGEYFAVFIKDAAACCAQGLEFVRAGGSYTYPDDYPEIDADITVVGTFNTYTEGSYTYARLKDAVMQTDN